MISKIIQSSVLIFLLLVNVHMSSQGAVDSRETVSIAGQIIDEHESPFVSQITAYRYVVQDGGVYPQAESVTTSDGNGGFRFENLSPGRYVLVARVSRVRQSDVIEPNPPLFAVYPINGSGLRTALLAHRGATIWVDLRVEKAIQSRVTICSQEKEPAEPLQIFFRGEEVDIPMGAIQTTASLRDCEYLVGLPPGRYSFLRTWKAQGERYDEAGTSIIGSMEDAEVLLSKLGSTDISGVISLAGLSIPETGSVVLRPIDFSGDLRHQYAAEIAKEGTFEFKGVSAGKYSVAVSDDSLQRLFVKQLFRDGRRIDEAVLDIQDPSPPIHLSIEASRATASVSGFIDARDCGPKAGVLLHSTTSGTNIIAPLDSRGIFKINAIPPGQYILFGWDNLDAIPYENLQDWGRHYAAQSILIEGDSITGGLSIACNGTEY